MNDSKLTDRRLVVPFKKFQNLAPIIQFKFRRDLAPFAQKHRLSPLSKRVAERARPIDLLMFHLKLKQTSLPLVNRRINFIFLPKFFLARERRFKTKRNAVIFTVSGF